MLQIHMYAQLAHWAVVTHDTVEDRYKKDRLLIVLFALWLFKSRLFKKRKNLLKLNKFLYSLSLHPGHD